MDKYQKFLMSIEHSYYGLATNGQISKDKILVDNSIVLTQNDDITISDYVLYIANDSIDSIIAVKGMEEKDFSKELDPVYSFHKSERQDRFFIAINFEDQLDGIKIIFKNKLADDLYLPLSYVLADKEKFYAKKERERKDNLLKNADIKVSTGADLVNIYFQPCCNKYEYTEIQLFIPKEEKVKGRTGYGRKVVEILGWSLIKKCKVDMEEFYKSIKGLAIGKYSFILKQYDKNGNILLETDYIEFSIDAPPQVEWGQINVI